MPPDKDKKGDPPDPYADWTDEEKAEWDAGKKFRDRHAAETSAGLLESIKDLLFNDPAGGGVDDPDGDDDTDAGAGDAGGGAGDGSGQPWVPWFERKIGGQKASKP